jgi:hypothetical protein
LGEDVADGGGFVGEGDGEGGFEEGDQMRDLICAEVGEGGKGQKEANGLHFVRQYTLFTTLVFVEIQD